MQQDILIVWTDPLTKDDLALSFLDSRYCKEIFEQILEIRSKISQVQTPFPSKENLAKIEEIFKEEVPTITQVSNLFLYLRLLGFLGCLGSCIQ